MIRKPASFVCPQCSQPLVMHRSWRQVRWRCKVCGIQYDLVDLLDQLDDSMESALASLQCNRI